MINKLLDWLCPSRKQVVAYQSEAIGFINEIAFYKTTIQRLEDILAAKKNESTTTFEELSVSAHAIHRYRERCKGKGTDDEIRKYLYKGLIRQLATMDTLPNGHYTLYKGVTGRIENNTLVTVIPNRDIGAPKLK